MNFTVEGVLYVAWYSSRFDAISIQAANKFHIF